MTALEHARWQFAVTTLYPFLFVPVTIGTAWFVAGFQTAWNSWTMPVTTPSAKVIRKSRPKNRVSRSPALVARADVARRDTRPRGICDLRSQR